MMRNNRLRRFARGEDGFSLVFVAMGFLGFLAVSMLAIDVGMLMTSRNQAQNSADASALAGATALVYDSWTDRTPSGPAVKNALAAGRTNQVMGGVVSVTPKDIVFLNDAAGVPDRVKSTVYRDTAHKNPIPTLIAQYFGIRTVNISATATAEASAANAETCVLPFTIPDKWTEHSDGTGKADGPWTPNSTFDIYYTKGSNQNGGTPLPNPDVYVAGPTASGGTGYDPNDITAAIGTQIVLKSNNQNKVSPSVYNPWDMPGSTGGADYSNNISHCNTAIITIGDFLTPETGNMVGPTKSGVDDLVAKDPTAYWDGTCNCVMNSAGKDPGSPRIGKVPLYNPMVYASGQQSGKSGPQLQVTNYLGFFVEGVTGSGDVTGRITPIGGIKNGNGPATGGAAFPKVIRLVQ